MALRNNKQIGVSKAKQEVAANLRKSARTKYLPHVSALGGYVWTSKEISLLSDDQKGALNNLGTNAATGLQSSLAPYVSTLPQALQMRLAGDLTTAAGMLDHAGQGIVNALRTDTRNMMAGAIVVTQPVFMGGAIIAANKIADISEQMAANSLDAQRQTTLFNIDKAYWQVVSLRHKEHLAESFLTLVKKLDDGMLLCQLCGLPVSEQILLADEETDQIAVTQQTAQPDVDWLSQQTTICVNNS